MSERCDCQAFLAGYRPFKQLVSSLADEIPPYTVVAFVIFFQSVMRLARFRIQEGVRGPKAGYVIGVFEVM